MTLGERIQQQLGDHAKALHTASELLAEPLSEAVECMVGALSDDHKIIACANAPSDADCERLVGVLLGRFERDRLALPALSLSTKIGQDTNSNQDQSTPDFARQIEGLGRSGDVLLAMSSLGNCSNVLSAVLAAQQRGMRVIAITGKNSGLIAEALIESDVHIAVPSERLAVVDALQRIVLNCLCDAIDWNLLGDEA